MLFPFAPLHPAHLLCVPGDHPVWTALKDPLLCPSGFRVALDDGWVLVGAGTGGEWSWGLRCPLPILPQVGSLTTVHSRAAVEPNCVAVSLMISLHLPTPCKTIPLTNSPQITSFECVIHFLPGSWPTQWQKIKWKNGKSRMAVTNAFAFTFLRGKLSFGEPRPGGGEEQRGWVTPG